MIIKIFYSLNLLTFVAGAIIYSPKYRIPLYPFYLRMAFSEKFRKCFRLMLFAILMVQHFYYLSIFHCHYDVMVSTAMCFVLISEKTTERIFRYFQDSVNFFIVSLAVCGIVAVPYCFMIGIVMAMLLLGSMFYPSASVLNAWTNCDTRYNLIDNMAAFFCEYYSPMYMPDVSSQDDKPSAERSDRNQK